MCSTSPVTARRWVSAASSWPGRRDCGALWRALREHLLARGGVWGVLAEQNLMCARNQELCGLDTELTDGDEVAFFPTVTGG